MGLGARRVAPGAAIAYWLGNPVLNPATIVFIGFVLGWRWALVRIVAGAVLVLGAGWLVNRFAGDAAGDASGLPQPPAQDEDGNVWRRWLHSLAGLALGVVPEWLVIVLLLGFARAWLFPAMNPAIGAALWLLPAFAIAGTLFVIPTAGEVPILQVLSRYGLGAGSFGVLLLALPAISLPSMLMVARRRTIAPRLVALAGAAVAVAALALGLTALALGIAP